MNIAAMIANGREHNAIWQLYLWERNFDRDFSDVLMRGALARGRRFWCLPRPSLAGYRIVNF